MLVKESLDFQEDIDPYKALRIGSHRQWTASRWIPKVTEIINSIFGPMDKFRKTDWLRFESYYYSFGDPLCTTLYFIPEDAVILHTDREDYEIGWHLENEDTGIVDGELSDFESLEAELNKLYENIV